MHEKRVNEGRDWDLTRQNLHLNEASNVNHNNFKFKFDIIKIKKGKL